MDEIKLACGLELTKREAAYHLPGTDIRFLPNSLPYGSCPIAWSRNDAGHIFETDEQALTWLSSRVEELVASLGAVIVPEDARERIERAIVDRRLALGKDDEGLRHEIGGHPHVSWVEKEYASAVLSALGMVRR